MQISVITLTWNSERYIGKMLSSLLNSLKACGVEFEILVIDNGSKDNTLGEIRLFSDQPVTVIPLGRNMGTSFSRNIGLRMCKMENVLIVDSDTEFTADSIKNLLEAFDNIKSNKIGIIHPRLLHPSGEVQNSALKFPSIMNKLERFFGKCKVNYDLTKTQKIDYGMSAAWLFKRSILEKAGYLDENIFYAPEDAEYCHRLWVHGLEVWYYPKATILHHYQRITSKHKFSKMWFVHLKGLVYYWTKYYKVSPP